MFDALNYNESKRTVLSRRKHLNSFRNFFELIFFFFRLPSNIFRPNLTGARVQTIQYTLNTRECIKFFAPNSHWMATHTHTQHTLAYRLLDQRTPQRMQTPSKCTCRWIATRNIQIGYPRLSPEPINSYYDSLCDAHPEKFILLARWKSSPPVSNKNAFFGALKLTGWSGGEEKTKTNSRGSACFELSRVHNKPALCFSRLRRRVLHATGEKTKTKKNTLSTRGWMHCCLHAEYERGMPYTLVALPYTYTTRTVRESRVSY